MRISAWSATTTVLIARLPSIQRYKLGSRTSFAQLKVDLLPSRSSRVRMNIDRLRRKYHRDFTPCAATHPFSFRHPSRSPIGKVRHIMALSLRECSNSVPVTSSRTCVIVERIFQNNATVLFFFSGISTTPRWSSIESQQHRNKRWIIYRYSKLIS